MKKKFRKTLAAFIAALMVVAAMPFTSFAATTLTFTEDSGIETENYSFLLNNGSNGDYIANVLQNVGTDKKITIEEGTESVTVTLNAGYYTGTNNSSTDFTSLTGGGWYYGSSTSYAISTDTTFTLTGSGLSASVSGFGATTNDNGSTYYATTDSAEAATIFTLDTSALEAGSYDLSLTYKYQMKKYARSGLSYSWGTNFEYSGTIALTLVVESADDENTVRYTYNDGTVVKLTTDDAAPANTASFYTNNNNGTHTLTTYKWVESSIANRYVEEPATETTDCTYGDGVVTAAKDCTENAVITYTCTACGYVKTEAGAAGAHSIEAVAAKDATCTEIGYNNGYYKCTLCGKYFSDEAGTTEVEESAVVIPASGVHTTEATSAVPATCLTQGNIAYWHCTVCGKYFSDAECTTEIEYNDTVIEAINHKNAYVEAKDATCTEAGYEAYYYCPDCDKMFTDSTCTVEIESPTVIPATDHASAKSVDEKTATCTETGHDAYYYCSDCGTYFTVTDDGERGDETTLAALTIDKDPNNHGENTFTAKTVGPTCYEQGYTTYTCNGCGEQYKETDTYTEALNHINATLMSAQAATCVAAGNTAYWYCPDCRNYFTDDDGTLGTAIDLADTTIEIDSSNHVEIKEQTATPAGCVTDGNIQYWYCTACGTYFSDADGSTVITDKDSVVIAATGSHTYVDTVTNPPTCTETGLKDQVCSVCGDPQTNVVIPANGHTTTHKEAVAATCTTDGNREYWYCTVCYKYFSDEECTTELTVNDDVNETVIAAAHTPVTDDAVAATCTSTGLTEGSHCSVCNEVLVAQETIEKLDHTPVTDAAVAATCTSTGLTEGSHCSVCNEVLVAQTVTEKLAHTAVTDAAVAATCTSTGLTEGSHCSVCDEVLVAQTVTEKLDHTAVTDEAVAATCTSTGLTEGSHCSVCSEVLVKQEVIPVTEHTAGDTLTDDETVVPATCTTDGSHEVVTYCAECGAEISRQTIIDTALGHDWDEGSETTPATCTTLGVWTYNCSRCEETKTDDIPMLAHTPDSGTVTKEPTCTEAGERVYTCTVCENEIETQEIPAAGHAYSLIEESAATCTETGWTYSVSATVNAAVLLDGEADAYYYNCAVCGTMASADTATPDENTVYTELSEEEAAAVIAQHTVQTLEHTPGDAQYENYDPETATTDGSIDEVYYCTECGAELSRTTLTIAATGTEDPTPGDDDTPTTEPTTGDDTTTTTDPATDDTTDPTDDTEEPADAEAPVGDAPGDIDEDPADAEAPVGDAPADLDDDEDIDDADDVDDEDDVDDTDAADDAEEADEDEEADETEETKASTNTSETSPKTGAQSAAAAAFAVLMSCGAACAILKGKKKEDAE